VLADLKAWNDAHDYSILPEDEALPIATAGRIACVFG
jgi:hypothetical protein